MPDLTAHRSGRRDTVRAAAAPARAWGATGSRAARRALSFLAALGVAAAAHAQGTTGQIYIPGPGESHPVQPAAPAAVSAAAGTNGMIVIPGPGETAASQRASATSGTAGASASNTAIVIPGPGEARAATTAAPTPRAVASSGTAARVLPVVETPAQRGTRAVAPLSVEPPAGVAAPARTELQRPAATQGEATPRTSVTPSAAVRSVTVPTASTQAAPAAAATPAAAAVPAGQQDGEQIRSAALAFLQQQTTGLPGKVTVTVAPTFPRGLAACTTLVPFMPAGSRLWGRTSVGVRCAGEHPWTAYLQARIAIEATYYLAARQIEPNTVLSAADLLPREGDLSNLPRAVVTDPSQAVGALALSRIGAGVPLRQDLLRSASSVTIGQTVRVVALGQGFQISAEGNVMNNAAPGEQVRVKMASGQVISGVVKDGSTVEIQM